MAPILRHSKLRRMRKLSVWKRALRDEIEEQDLEQVDEVEENKVATTTTTKATKAAAWGTAEAGQAILNTKKVRDDAPDGTADKGKKAKDKGRRGSEEETNNAKSRKEEDKEEEEEEHSGSKRKKSKAGKSKPPTQEEPSAEAQASKSNKKHRLQEAQEDNTHVEEQTNETQVSKRRRTQQWQDIEETSEPGQDVEESRDVGKPASTVKTDKKKGKSVVKTASESNCEVDSAATPASTAAEATAAAAATTTTTTKKRRTVTSTSATATTAAASPSLVLSLALRALSRSSSSLRNEASSCSSSSGKGVSSETHVGNASGGSQPSSTLQQPPAPPKRDVMEEVRRILAAETKTPLQVLGLNEAGPVPEEKISQAWKKLVLLLHPDKLQHLSEKDREAGASALHLVHQAKDELRQQSQATCAEVPARPGIAANPECLANTSGQRKYEISWAIPESQDPKRPIEKYEIWGPRHFSEHGEPYEWTLLATLPALQSQFVLVEEAPTQQDVMWAADRVLRPSLPISVHAVNGRGSSEALTFELPWATIFPWLQGVPSVMCSQCFKLSCCQGSWTRCLGCHSPVPIEQRIVVRCQQCQGEVLWVPQLHVLRCTCCLTVLGKEVAQQWRPGTKPMMPQAPQHPQPQTNVRARGQVPWTKRPPGNWQAGQGW